MRPLEITLQSMRDAKVCKTDMCIFERWLDSMGVESVALTVENIKKAQDFKIYAQALLSCEKGRNLSSGHITREMCVELGPDWAYDYALFVDQGPHDATRAEAIKDSELAWMYAKYVDQSPRNDTRTAACGTPEDAYAYAAYVDCGPSKETKEAAYKEEEWALAYRHNVELNKESHD